VQSYGCVLLCNKSNDGLLKTADFLRGDNAKEFIDEYKATMKGKK